MMVLHYADREINDAKLRAELLALGFPDFRTVTREVDPSEVVVVYGGALTPQQQAQVATAIGSHDESLTQAQQDALDAETATETANAADRAQISTAIGILNAYIGNGSPTAAQTVTCVKACAGLVRFMVRRWGGL